MLVIGLGIAILVVLALMIGMAVRQALYPKTGDAAAPAAAATTTASLKPGDVPELNLGLAPGMSVADTRMDGTHLIVRLTGPTAEEILVIDPAKQRVLSRIRFNKAPAP